MKSFRLLRIITVVTFLLPTAVNAGCIPFFDENCLPQNNGSIAASSYEETVAEWGSYDDVAKWVNDHRLKAGGL